jgi:predicted  nucleic acid-binding Zn-ribbon protein
VAGPHRATSWNSVYATPPQTSHPEHYPARDPLHALSETDDHYQRLKTRWESHPNDFEDPLLARAFAEAQPNQDIVQQLEALRAISRNQIDELQAQLAASQQKRAALERDAHQHTEKDMVRLSRIRHLEGELEALKRRPRKAPPRAGEVNEREVLAALGWRKV